MEKSTIRGRRRADLARMKKRARAIYTGDSSARNANHLAACSCHMCGNERRHFGNIAPSELRSAGMMRVKRNGGKCHIRDIQPET